jgi:membrane protease YdiL (CAAX protease family)
VRFEAWLGVPNGILILTPLVLSAIAFDYAILGYLFQNMWEEWGVAAAISMATILYLVSGFGTDISVDAIWPAAVVAAMTVILGLTVVWTGSIWFALGFHIMWNAIVDPTGSQPYYALQFSMLIMGFFMLLVARRLHVFEFNPPREAYASVSFRPRD